VGKERGKKKEEQKEMRHHQEMREREAAQAHEADRERKRERARRAKAAGLGAIRKGNTPVVLSRPRVLAGLYQIMSDFITSSTGSSVCIVKNFNRTSLECVLSVTCVSLQ
jgi:FtsZ-interacting cell division protein YlmF